MREVAITNLVRAYLTQAGNAGADRLNMVASDTGQTSWDGL